MAAPMRLYIGGLPGDITNEDLEGRFRPFGQVLSVTTSFVLSVLDPDPALYPI